MHAREALAALVDVALISENDRARILAMIPSMSDEEVQRLGEVFAEEELALDERLSATLEHMDAFLKNEPPEAAAA